jgi:hypothetical protein
VLDFNYTGNFDLSFLISSGAKIFINSQEYTNSLVDCKIWDEACSVSSGKIL